MGDSSTEAERKTMSITSDEVNFLIYRYLLESGFQHSAFTFSLESHVHQSNINGSLVPPGALVSVMQKGLQYVEAEISIAEDGSIVENKEQCPLSLVDAVMHDALNQRPTKTKMEVTSSHSTAGERGGGGAKEGEPMDTADLHHSTSSPPPPPSRSHSHSTLHTSSHNTTSSTSSNTLTLPSSKVLVLKGHQSEVFTCAWSPTGDVLVSGSGDSTARLWNLEDNNNNTSTATGTVSGKSHDPSPSPSLLPPPPVVLPHEPVGGASRDLNRDVTTVHWNSDGSMLATGSYDGVARLWKCSGELRASLVQHSGPIFALKWNQKGNYIVTGGVDKTAIVWDVQSGQVKQQYAHHKAPTLDVDWQSNTCFASCSTDKLIHVYTLGTDKPFCTFQGHKSGVNAVKWDPSGALLASCSDDHTAKVWSLKQESCLHNLQEHLGDIYTLQWSPTGPGSHNPSAPLVLATASYDSTVKLWEVAEKGQCLHTLRRHNDPVYSVSFSPDGSLLASGSFDKWLYVWSTQDGSLVKQYKGSSGIFEVCWNKDGNKLAASLSNNSVCVLDLRTI